MGAGQREELGDRSPWPRDRRRRAPPALVAASVRAAVWAAAPAQGIGAAPGRNPAQPEVAQHADGAAPPATARWIRRVSVIRTRPGLGTCSIGAAQGGERGAQLAFGQAGDGSVDRRQFGRIGRGGRRRGATAIVGGLHEAQAVTTWLPRCALIRAITSAARYCSSIAIGPAQAMVSVPRASRRGVVTAAMPGRRWRPSRPAPGRCGRAAAERRPRQARHQRADRTRAVDVAFVLSIPPAVSFFCHCPCLFCSCLVPPPSPRAALARRAR